ncbi:conserved hypothetical protein [Vibrio crassostreae]|nr:conserved hypothetical protein [Vibrio chagasii]CAK2875152.1 conserved hypothetical protein [Vibrio crassostreae]
MNSYIAYRKTNCPTCGGDHKDIGTHYDIIGILANLDQESVPSIKTESDFIEYAAKLDERIETEGAAIFTRDGVTYEITRN